MSLLSLVLNIIGFKIGHDDMSLLSCPYKYNSVFMTQCFRDDSSLVQGPISATMIATYESTANTGQCVTWCVVLIEFKQFGHVLKLLFGALNFIETAKMVCLGSDVELEVFGGHLLSLLAS